MPTFLDASDGGRAAAHTVVQHGVALVGVGQNEVAQQVNGLLGGMKSITFYNSELDALLWIADARIVVSSTWATAEFAVSRFACFSESVNTPRFIAVWFAFRELRIVRALISIKHADDFDISQRLLCRIQMTSTAWLSLIPIVFELVNIAQSECAAEWFSTE